MPGEKKKLRSYRELLVWQHAMNLVVQSYRLAGKLPGSEQFGLSAQIRRAAVSIPANIAEGYGRWNSREYLHHLRIACGSLSELETHLLIAQKLSFLPVGEVEEFLAETSELGRMLSVLIQKLNMRLSAISKSPESKK